ncbi:MAG TPA: tetratricopeptide repeat protein [Gammaproteobacteria bacterium]
MLLFFVLGLLPFSSTAQTQTAQEFFAAGTELARQGDYPAALQQFNMALADGMQTAVLYYNLGVTNYRLGYLHQAASAFKRATSSPKMAGLAYYNLGLIARHQNNPALAREYFRRAEQSSRTENLRKLSRHALETLSPDSIVTPDNGSPNAERGLLWIEIYSGYDDNVLLAGAEDDIASGEEDVFGGTMVFGHYYTTGDRNNGLRIYGLSLLDRYGDLDNYDLDIAAAGTDYSITIDRWRHNIDILLLQSRLGGDRLENIKQLAVSSTTGLGGDFHLRLQLEYESIEAAPAYSFLDGKRYTGKLELSEILRDWKLEYSLEDNDRSDYLAEDGVFQSFSPQRHKLAVTKHFKLLYEWKLELEGAYMQSRYRDANILFDGTQRKRQDNRSLLSVRLYKPLLHDWRLGIVIDHTENKSNSDDADYSRNALTLTLDKAFRF